MIIGGFTYDRGTDTYSGSISTLALRCRIRFSRNAEPCRDLPFDYWVICVTALGNRYIGSATKMTAPSGHSYLCVIIEDPSFSQPMKAMLWPVHDLPAATLHWIRPSRGLRGLYERFFA